MFNATDGWVRVYNKGGYVARFFIDYHIPGSTSLSLYPISDLRFDLFQRTLSSGHYPVGRTRVLEFPRNALTGRIRVERFIFIPFGGWYWSEIFRQEFNPRQARCFDIWGTTSHPHWTNINC